MYLLIAINTIILVAYFHNLINIFRTKGQKLKCVTRARTNSTAAIKFHINLKYQSMSCKAL